MPQVGSEFTVAVVGAGPRGTSFLERLLAGLEREDRQRTAGSAPRLRVLVIDPAPHGPGRVWDPVQSPLYLMNTPASFPTAAPSGATAQEIPPSSVARSFLEFKAADPQEYPARAEYGRYLAALHQEVLAGLRAQGAAVEELHEEAIRLQPEAQHDDGGHLLTLRAPWDLAGGDRVDAGPVTSEAGLVHHRLPGSASGVPDELSDHTPSSYTRRADAVILALGHVPAQLNEAGRHFAQAAEELGLHYLPPAIPTEADFSALPPGQDVLVRGLGLNFFDLMIACTQARGGQFRTVPGAPPGRRVEYRASGKEPRLIAGSRRGAPYRAKAEVPTRAPGMVTEGVRLVHLTEEAVEEALRRHDVLDFSAHLWPLIQRDVLRTYFRTLAEVSPELFGAPHGSGPVGSPAAATAPQSSPSPARTASAGASRPEDSSAGPSSTAPVAVTPAGQFLTELDALLEDHHLGEQVLASQGARLLHRYAPEALWFDVRALGRPFDGLAFDSAAQHQQHVLAYLEDDAATSAAGRHSPVKMAVGALHAGRMKLKELIVQGRVSQASRAEEVEGWFEALVEGLASGPPLRRIEELAALVRAGVVEFLGPDPVYDVDRETGCFTAESPHVAMAEPHRAEVLIEAMMPANRVQLSASPLVSGLLRDGLARPAGTLDASGAYRAGKGFDVTAQPHRLIGAEGEPSESVFVLGLQLSSVQWGTAIAPEAGGDLRSSARTLADADTAAQAVLHRASR